MKWNVPNICRHDSGKSEDKIRIDFLEDFAKKNLQLVIDEILKSLGPFSIIRAGVKSHQNLENRYCKLKVFASCFRKYTFNISRSESIR